MNTFATPDVLIRPVSLADLADQDSPFSTSLTTLVVVDHCITDYTMLVDGIVSPAAILILDPQQDGIDQITTAILSGPCLQKLHLISHGAPGCLYLGNGQLSLETLDSYATQLSSWFSHANAQLLLYGCNVAAGDAGVEFIERLQCLTGAAIAASTTPIGSAALGGNWQLDATTTGMLATLCFQDATMQSYTAVFAAGVLDPSFGAGGIVLGSSGSGSGIGLQSDGRLLVTSMIPGSSSSFTLSRYNSDGSLDTSFGTGGTVTGSNNSGEDILIQPDGKIIVAGDTPNTIPGLPTSARSFSITRFNSDGSLDAGFGTGGTSLIHQGSVINDQFSAVLQSDGKILLGGYSFSTDNRSSIYTGSDSNGLLVRYNSDGSLDTSFGSGGAVFANITNERSYGFSVGLQANGEIVLAGASAPSSIPYPSLALWRFDASGTLLNSTKTGFIVNPSFTPPNTITPDLPSTNFPQVTVQADGRIVVAQATYSLALTGNSNTAFRASLLRFNSDLSLDSSFGNGGQTVGRYQDGTFSPFAPAYTNFYNGMTLQADGTIVVAGYNRQNGVNRLILERYTSNGALDNSFGIGGGVTTDLGAGNATAAGLVIQPDGKVVATGAANGNFALVRYTGISTAVNQAPTDINLSGRINIGRVSASTTASVLSDVGSLSTIDPDTNDSHLYSLVTGAGDTDNAAFRILGGSRLYFVQTFSGYPAPPPQSLKPNYTIRVRSDDGRGGIFEEAITIDANYAPIAAHIDGSSFYGIATLGSPLSRFFYEANIGDTFTIIPTLRDGSPLPAWLSFDPTTSVLSGTRGSNDPLVTEISVVAVDQHGSRSLNRTLFLSGSSNQAPTDLNLSNSSIAENLSAGTLVSTFSTTDPNPGDTFTYTLVAGTGATDNAAFTIVGNTLRSNQSFNFESKSNYSIRVRTTDNSGASFEKPLTITIQNVNEAPVVGTAIANQTTTTGTAFSLVVPTTTFSDPDAGDLLTLNATLSDGSVLPVWLSFNPTSRTFSGTPNSSNVGTINVLLRAIDLGGLSTSTGFSLTVNSGQVNQAPTNLSLSSTSIAENLVTGTTVGTFTTTDPNPGDTFTYSLVTGMGSTDNAAFAIAGNALRTAQSFNFEAKSTYSIRVRTTDNSGASFEKPLTITIQNVNEAPVVASAIANQTTTAGTAFNYTVPASTFADPDGDALTFSATLSDGTTLPSWLSFNPNTRTFSGTPGSSNVGSLSLRVQATDPAGLSTNSVFSLTVNGSNPNQAPTNLTLSSTSIAENLASGAIVGTFTTTDPNLGDTFTYALVSGTGSTNNAAFTIVDNTLRTNQSFNFEEKSSYSIRVRTSDGKGGTFERVLTISVLDRNDAPIVATPLTNRTATIGRTFRYTVPTGTFFDDDVEANDENDSLTLRATLSDGRALPTWLRFNTSTGTFSGTPPAGSAGTLNIMVTASDRARASVSSTFRLVVR